MILLKNFVKLRVERLRFEKNVKEMKKKRSERAGGFSGMSHIRK